MAATPTYRQLSARLSPSRTSIKSHLKRGGRRHSSKTETTEIGRLSPEPDPDIEEPPSKTVREEIDFLVQTTAKLGDELDSLTAKVNTVERKLDQIVDCLGVQASDQELANNTKSKKQRRSLQYSEENLMRQQFAGPSDLTESLRARREPRPDTGSVFEQARGSAADESSTSRPLPKASATQFSDGSDIEGLRRSLQTLNRYLNNL